MSFTSCEHVRVCVSRFLSPFVLTNVVVNLGWPTNSASKSNSEEVKRVWEEVWRETA